MSGLPRRFKTGEAVRDSETAGTVLVESKPCVVCGQVEEVEVDVDGYRRWQNGELIQDALRALPMDKRELLLSGTHSACWDRLWTED